VSRSWRRRLWIVGAVVLVSLATWRLVAAGKGPTVQYDTVTVDRGNVVARVTASGTLSALVTVQVGSQVTGRIQSLFVDFNSPVKKGQLLAKIDPRVFKADVEQARANDASARANLDKAKAQAEDAALQYQRAKDLAAKQIENQSDLDTARATKDAADAAVEAAAAAVQQAKAALDKAEVNLAYTNIISPTDGMVISRDVDVGQTVAASLQAPTLFVVAQDLRKMQVDTSVAESDIGRIRAGMPASFTVDAYPTVTFHGVVREVRNAPQTVQNVVTYDAVIDVANADLRLKPGMTANATFVYAQRDDVVRVPNAALRFHPGPALVAEMESTSPKSGPSAGTPRSPRPPAGTAPAALGSEPGKHEVFVLRGEHAEPVWIETGITDGTFSDVVSGPLRVGERLVTDARSDSASGSSRRRRPGFL
jgi:HlyD family secretion protein